VPKGGPDGGDGGHGGSVIFFADPHKDTLLDFAGKHHWKAQRGEHGMGQKMYGKRGDDLLIPVPRGTLIFDEEHQILLADLTEPGKQAIGISKARPTRRRAMPNRARKGSSAISSWN
jgi:GTP-binding protein